ncbi:MAG TPA: phytanoyl-CoA dioxygenase family protein [Acidimicrobiales bacterium]|nr:phytanoyl-CoA dioxygenase family protein [Acidimicrobiales bacterium]
MEIGDWAATRELNGIYGDIRRLGLEANLAELEAFGFTVIEGALGPELTEELKGAILAVASERVGHELDPVGETEYTGMEFQPYLLFRDPVFKRSVLNPGPLALITYLLGRHCVLSSLGCHLKGPGGSGLPLHSDTANGMPSPFPAPSQVANCNYALTDYTEEDGCLAVVPGSHRQYRQPTRWEAMLEGEGRNPHAVAVEVPAGSAIVWHGATWHGSFPRRNPGLRINLSNYFCRPYLMPQEEYPSRIPAGFLEGEDPRLGRLLGQELAYGWHEEGPTRRQPSSRTWQS